MTSYRFVGFYLLFRFPHYRPFLFFIFHCSLLHHSMVCISISLPISDIKALQWTFFPPFFFFSWSFACMCMWTIHCSHHSDIPYDLAKVLRRAHFLIHFADLILHGFSIRMQITKWLSIVSCDKKKNLAHILHTTTTKKSKSMLMKLATQSLQIYGYFHENSQNVRFRFLFWAWCFMLALLKRLITINFYSTAILWLLRIMSKTMNN